MVPWPFYLYILLDVIDRGFSDSEYFFQKRMNDTNHSAKAWRCWIVWNRNWKVALVPFSLVIIGLGQ
jgi:hypothetical protein